MEAATAQRFQFPLLFDWRKFEEKPSGSLCFSRQARQQKRPKALSLAYWQCNNINDQNRSLSLGILCSHKNSPDSLLEAGRVVHASSDAELILKRKAQEIKPYLNGRSIYLVGMMGSGKTTVGKLLSKALDYSFFDCDTLIEKDLNGATVADIFEHYGESFFRDKETEALRKLSLMYQVVVSTGGGAVVRPINWKYMHQGVSVWLDVPLEALARRIAAVGTDSRPLLHDESGDAYTVAYKRLSTIWDQRGEAYTNANARVSLENIAAKDGHRDVSDLTPAAIAIEAFEQVLSFLDKAGRAAASS